MDGGMDIYILYYFVTTNRAREYSQTAVRLLDCPRDFCLASSGACIVPRRHSGWALVFLQVL